MRVAVVVLTWNGRDDTLACLESLAGLDWPDLDVIVADNASTDGTQAAVREHHPNVHYIDNGANLGFAEGNNRGIRAALERDADAILILNNDATVPAELLTVLTATLGPGVGAVCPVVRFASDPERVWFAGSHYDPGGGHTGRPSAWERGTQPLPAEAVEIDRAVGAAMLVTRATIERLGVFDPELFFLYEDVDWSMRMRGAGLRVLLEPRISIAHHVAASQGGEARTPLTLYYGTRNDLEVRRRYGPSGLRHELGCVLVHVSVAARAPRRRVAAVLAALAGWRDYKRRRFGAWA